jgi:hypothetical protein
VLEEYVAKGRELFQETRANEGVEIKCGSEAGW